jgi:hypothetical protein
MPWISKYFELSTPRLLTSAFGLRMRLKQKVIFFSRETNHRPIACHPHKAGRHWTYCAPSFLALAFSSSTAFIIHYSMADTTIHAPTAPVVPSANADDSGHDSGVESAAMAASSPTRGATRMAAGEIPELTNFFKKTTVSEDDRRAYHDRGWLIGILVSFIPEVDVPTVEGSTIICFESQLAAGVGLPPNKFLSSIMNYLGCSLVHLNSNAISVLSSFIMLCECWLGIPLDTSLFWYYYSPVQYTKTIFGGIIFSLRRNRRDEYMKATFKGCWKHAQQKWILVDMQIVKLSFQQSTDVNASLVLELETTHTSLVATHDKLDSKSKALDFQVIHADEAVLWLKIIESWLEAAEEALKK